MEYSTTKIPQMKKTANNHHTIHELIKSRWSPRMFSDRPISDEDMNSLFEAARWAASSNNLQPWRFMYFRKGTEAYDQVFNCLAEFNQRWVGNAPVLILTAYKEKTPKGQENFHALHDLGLSVGNMSLQAEAMGIALHQMAGIDWRKMQEILKVPEGSHISTAIAAGHYGGDSEELEEDFKEMEYSERKRNPITTFVAEGKWPEE